MSDLFSLPNLSLNGQTYLRYWRNRYLFGLPTTLPDWSMRETLATIAYAWAALAWRMMVCITLIVASSYMFHGAGIVLAVFATLVWIGLPIVRFFINVFRGNSRQQPRWRYTAKVFVPVTATVAGVLVFVPWPGRYSVPGIVEYAPHTVVRAASSGFVTQIHVEAGQFVDAGQTLLTLENIELQCDVKDLELQIRQSEFRVRQFEQKGEIAAEQAESKLRESLQTQLAEKESQLNQLVVKSPTAGIVVRRELPSVLGQFLKEGDEIVAIGNESAKELHLSVAQEDVESFLQHCGEPVVVHVPGRRKFTGQLDRVIPRATQHISHPALSTINGGPLPVKAVTNSAKSEQAGYELLRPRFLAFATLNAEESLELHSGQRVTVSFRPMNESVGNYLYRWAAVRTWLPF